MAEKKTYTEEQKKEALELEAAIGNRAAAEKTGISWQQIARWKKEAGSAETAPEKKQKSAKTKTAANKATKNKPGKAAKETANKKATASTASKAPKAGSKKLTIIVQNPFGGNITASEIADKLPAGCDTVFVRVDQNKLWWVKDDETGSVDIW